MALGDPRSERRIVPFQGPAVLTPQESTLYITHVRDFVNHNLKEPFAARKAGEPAKGWQVIDEQGRREATSETGAPVRVWVTYRAEGIKPRTSGLHLPWQQGDRLNLQSLLQKRKDLTTRLTRESGTELGRRLVVEPRNFPPFITRAEVLALLDKDDENIPDHIRSSMCLDYLMLSPSAARGLDQEEAINQFVALARFVSPATVAAERTRAVDEELTNTRLRIEPRIRDLQAELGDKEASTAVTLARHERVVEMLSSLPQFPEPSSHIEREEIDLPPAGAITFAPSSSSEGGTDPSERPAS